MPNDVVAAVDRFLAVFHTESSSDTGLQRLIETLDRLAWLAHGIEYEFDEYDYPDPPSGDHRATATLAFQWLNGMRHTATHPSIGGVMYPETDLAELADDMEAIHWRFQHTSEADALFHYQLGFYSHWGHHLRSLQMALHEWYW